MALPRLSTAGRTGDDSPGSYSPRVAASPRLARRPVSEPAYQYTRQHLSDSLIQPLVLQLRAGAITRVAVDGAGVEMSAESWRFFFEQVLSPDQRVTSVTLTAVNVEPLVDCLCSGIVLARTLAELTFTSCTGLSANVAMSLARAIAAQRSVRVAHFSGPSFLSKRDSRRFVQILFSSLSLLSLSVPFETGDTLMAFQAQNQKLGLHLDRPPTSCLIYERGLTCLPALVMEFESLTELNVSQNQLTGFPLGITRLQSLALLNASQNAITRAAFPMQLARMPKLTSVDLSGNPATDGLPAEVSPTNLPALLAHFALPPAGSAETVLCSTVRVMIVGPAGVGRSSLLRSLASLSGISTVSSPRSPSGGSIPTRPRSPSNARDPSQQRASRRVTAAAVNRRRSFGRTLSGSINAASELQPALGEEDIMVADLSSPDDTITLRLWELSSAAHTMGAAPFFMTAQLVYVVMFDVADPDYATSIEEYLDLVEARAQGATVMLVGSHRDRLAVTVNVMALCTQIGDRYRRRKRSSVAGCLLVDARASDAHMSELHARLKKATLNRRQAELASQVTLGSTVPRSFLQLPLIVRQEVAVRAVPVVTLAEFADMCAPLGIRRGAPVLEAVDYLRFMGDVVIFARPPLADLVVLDPGWLCVVLARLMRSEVLLSLGGFFQSRRMSSIWPLHEFPAESYAFIIAFLRYFDLLHALVPRERAVASQPPFANNSLASAFVVPAALTLGAGAKRSESIFFDGQSSQVLSVNTLAATQTYQRQYRFPHFPAKLRTQLLFRLLDVTSVHSSVWANGVVCGQAGTRCSVIAEWSTPSAKTPSLKLFFVSHTREAASRFIYLIVVTVEELLEHWFPNRGHECSIVKQSGVTLPIDDLVTMLLSGGIQDEKELQLLAPDLLAQQAVRISGSVLTKERDLGAGSFGTIELHRWGERQVVLKKLVSAGDDPAAAVEAYREFLRECWMMSFLRHPKVIRLEGVVFEPLAMVLEYCNGGDLRSFLDAHEGIDWQVRLALARDVALGLSVAHQFEPPIVHRDVKSPNIFIHRTEERGIEARVGDLGLATFLAGSFQARLVDNPTWSAPECIRKADDVTESSDTFSFAIIMWELLTNRFPYEDLMAEYGFASKLCEAIENWNARPTLPKTETANQPADFVPLMVACWAQEPTLRPSLFEVLHRITVMLEAEYRRDAALLAGLRYECLQYGSVQRSMSAMCRSGSLVYMLHQPSRHVCVMSAVTGKLVRCFRTPELSAAEQCRLIAAPDDGCWAATLGSVNVYVMTREANTYGVTGVCEPRLLQLPGLVPELSRFCAMTRGDAPDTIWVMGAVADEYRAVLVDAHKLTATSFMALPHFVCCALFCRTEQGLALLVSSSAQSCFDAPMSPRSGGGDASRRQSGTYSPHIIGADSPHGDMLKVSAKLKQEEGRLLTPEEVFALMSDDDAAPLPGPLRPEAIARLTESGNRSRASSSPVSVVRHPLEMCMSLDLYFVPQPVPHGATSVRPKPPVKPELPVTGRRVIRQLAVGDSEIWILFARGDLVIISAATLAVVNTLHLPLWCDSDTDPLDMVLLDGEHWVVAASLHNFVALPTRDYMDPDKRVVHLLADSSARSSQPAPASLRPLVSLAAIPGASMFYYSNHVTTTRWCISVVGVPSASKVCALE